MKYLIKNIAYPIEKQPSLKQMLCEKIGINGKRVKSVELVKKSIDARHKNHLKFNFTLVAELSGKMPDNPDITPFAPVVPDYPPKVSLNCDNPIIIGAGPAGLFAAYQLCLNGFKPVIFEKGDDIKNRNIKVESFWNDAKSFDEDTNVQFGEGGAGAFK